jgi:hypothetical protein
MSRGGDQRPSCLRRTSTADRGEYRQAAGAITEGVATAVAIIRRVAIPVATLGRGVSV